jgi:hypothetical protein
MNICDEFHTNHSGQLLNDESRAARRFALLHQPNIKKSFLQERCQIWRKKNYNKTTNFQRKFD